MKLIIKTSEPGEKTDLMNARKMSGFIFELMHNAKKNIINDAEFKKKKPDIDFVFEKIADLFHEEGLNINDFG